MINEAAAILLSEPVLMIERQIDMAKLIIGWQSGRELKIFRLDGSRAGYIREASSGVSTVAARQFAPDHRSYKFLVYNEFGEHCLTIRRPAKAVNSKICAYSADDKLLGTASQQFHLWRRKYELYTPPPPTYQEAINSSRNSARPGPDDSSTRESFGVIDVKALSYDLPVKDPKKNRQIAGISRKWSGFCQELYTTHGLYKLDFQDSHKDVLSLDKRAILLAAALSIDTDFFSKEHKNRRAQNGQIMSPGF